MLFSSLLNVRISDQKSPNMHCQGRVVMIALTASDRGIKMTDFAVRDKARPDLGGNIHHGDNATFCPVLWRYLVDRFAVNSVLDVGCGEGHAVRFFQRLGVIAHGIDGLRANVDRAVTPIAHHDILQTSYYMPVDLVWSCEVAEHIRPEKVDNYVDTLANGRIVAMTHALPGQGGHHHVNCQPQEYWVEKLAQRGFSLAPFYETYRRVAGSDLTTNYFVKSGLVFFRNNQFTSA